MNVWPLTVPFMAGAQEYEPPEDVETTTRTRRAKPIINPDAESMIGRIVYDWQTGEAWEIFRKQRSRDTSGNMIKASYGLIQRNPNGRGGRTRSLAGGTWDTGAGTIFQMGENGTITTSRVLREDEQGAGGTGSTARDYAGEASQQHGYDVELERMKQAFEAEQRRLDDERAMELERLREENAMKRAKLGEAGSLARTAAEVQQRARQFRAELQGVDPVRQGIAAQGGVQRGTTPAQAFDTELAGIANAPLPQVNENASIPEIDQVIQSLQGHQQMPVAPALGFAAGGSVDMGQAPQAQLGTSKRAILVGEKGGFTGDEEIIVMDSAQPGNIEVIPLMAGAAEGGAFDISSIKGALAPIYGSMGFSGELPSTTRDQYGAFSVAPSAKGGGPATAQALGYQPRLLRAFDTGAIYFRNPKGVLQRIATPELFRSSGFQPQDVMSVFQNEVGQFGQIGEDLTSAPPMIESGVRKGARRATPLITPPGAGSIPLPDPALLAGIWRFLDQGTKTTLLSAYGVVPGMGGLEGARGQIEETVRMLTPAGTQTRGRSARFA